MTTQAKETKQYDARVHTNLHQCPYAIEHGVTGTLQCAGIEGHAGPHADSYGGDAGEWFYHEAPSLRSSAVGASIEDYKARVDAGYLGLWEPEKVSESMKDALAAHNRNAYVYTAIDLESAVRDAVSLERERLLSYLRDMPQRPDSAFANSDTDPSQAYELGRKDGFISARLALEGLFSNEPIVDAPQPTQEHKLSRCVDPDCPLCVAEYKAYSDARYDEQIAAQAGTPLTDIFPDGILASGSGYIYTEPEAVKISVPPNVCSKCYYDIEGRVVARCEEHKNGWVKADSASRPLSHLRSDGDASFDPSLIIKTDEPLSKYISHTNGKQIVVGNMIYGVLKDCMPYRCPNVQTVPVNQIDTDFAAPVAAYIAEHGWKWKEVRVTYFADMFVVYWNDSKGVKLAYNVAVNGWCAPTTIES